MDIAALLLAGIAAGQKFGITNWATTKVVRCPPGMYDYDLPTWGIDTEHVELEKFAHQGGGTIHLGYSSRLNVLLYAEPKPLEPEQ